MDLLDKIIKKHGSGVLIDLFVTPNAEVNLFPAGVNNWRKRIEIKVCSIAKDNQANLELIKLIAKFYDKPIKSIFILRGKKTREKTIQIENISKDTVLKKLRESLNGL
jgi:uncharacterized protein (TIGR00251 family)